MMAILIYLLLVLTPYATSIFFNFTDLSSDSDYISLTGAAYISDEGIQLTPDRLHRGETAAGQAVFHVPLRLWEGDAYKELASFSTSFSFVIDSTFEPNYGYGLTFFLADRDDYSEMLGGGAMGLPISRFVAVEFDSFRDPQWDPLNGDHVGIDVNSLESRASQKWLSNITYGIDCQAWINYDSVSQNLSVSFTGFQDKTVGLECQIDMGEELPEWVVFGFSASTGKNFQKNLIKSWTFNSSEIIFNGNILVPSPPSPSFPIILPPITSPESSPQDSSQPPITSPENSPQDSSQPPITSPENNPQSNSQPPITSHREQVKGKNGAGHRVLVRLLAGLFVLIAILAMLAFFYRWKKKNNGDKAEEQRFAAEMNREFEMGTGPRKFSYHELAHSTSHFAEKNKLGEGGFGGVYKGFLKDSSTYIAVKRVSKSSKQGIKEYASEVRIISRLRHKNLVQLIGWCHEKGELLLVYELMENGSLDSHLFKAKSLLTWETRYKIAHGLASALLYLHEEWEQCVLHRDIKSSNVMLDSNFNTKLGDFGLAKLVDHSKGSQTTILAGTLGYMAPECVVTGKASKESDVFSFGVVALEIACGRKSIDYRAPDTQIRLIEWVWRLYSTATLLEAVDPRLGIDFHEEEIKCLMIVGLWCCHPDSQLRPSIKQAIHVLNSEVSMPILPSNMPLASYLEPSMSSSDGVSSVIENQPLNSVSKYGR